VARLVGAVERSLGAPLILVNNAGIARPRALDAHDERAWDETIAVNLTSAFLVTQAVLPAMRRAQWGRIVNIASTAAHTGGSVGPHYAASKAGMIGLTHGYASRLLREGVTANVVSPAQIDTDMVRSDLRTSPDRVPVGRFGTVDEVAQLVVAVARNGYLTGQTINVNGGFYFT
jgi:3-oxoacyl-[acyl-carrier protein] reductase